MPIPDDTQPHLTAEQEKITATEFIREGFARLQAAGMRTEALAPHAEALRRIHDHRDREAGILHLLDTFLGGLAVSLGEVGEPEDHEQATAVEWLNAACSRLQGVAGHVDRAREALEPLRGGGRGDARLSARKYDATGGAGAARDGGDR